MKAIDKHLLFANNHQHYAITEANILREVKHPFILSMYFAFQVAILPR